jgi:hypothetical protein
MHLPVWAEYSSRDGKLPSERPPWLGGELGRLSISSTSTQAACSVHLILLGPDSIAIPIRPLGLEEPAVVVPVSGLAPGHGLLGAHDGEPPLHPGSSGARRRGQRERRPAPGCGISGSANDVVKLRVLVWLLAPGADGTGVLDGVGEALGADLEVALTGEDVVAALVAHDVGVAAVDGAGGAPGPRHLRVAGLRVDDLVHEVRARDTVEAAREEGVGDVLLLHAGGDGRVHGLVVGRGRDVDVVAGELLVAVGGHVDAGGAELAVEVVAGVADVASRAGAAGEGDHGAVAARGGGRLRAGVVASAAGEGHAREAAAVAVAEAAAAAGGGHGGRPGYWRMQVRIGQWRWLICKTEAEAEASETDAMEGHLSTEASSVYTNQNRQISLRKDRKQMATFFFAPLANCERKANPTKTEKSGRNPGTGFKARSSGAHADSDGGEAGREGRKPGATAGSRVR